MTDCRKDTGMIWYVVTDTEENYHRSSAFYDHKFALERTDGFRILQSFFCIARKYQSYPNTQ